MSKLEVEYDYDTDEEQLQHSNNLLLRELQQAVEFFVMDDPLKLVDNVRLWATWCQDSLSFSLLFSVQFIIWGWLT